MTGGLANRVGDTGKVLARLEKDQGTPVRGLAEGLALAEDGDAAAHLEKSEKKGNYCFFKGFRGKNIKD